MLVSQTEKDLACNGGQVAAFELGRRTGVLIAWKMQVELKVANAGGGETEEEEERRKKKKRAGARENRGGGKPFTLLIVGWSKCRPWWP
ncbi:hypothetical protein Scep_020032 [Stephania cephalantha]|uniref:Uncharacterized protein n=1 Tax=Stephania cephalantha TaxID=152367 RepID=A0AAP0IC03_9MAGN